MQEFLQRHIKSFVIRTGHMTLSQRSARERLMPIWGIHFAREPLDFKAVFGREGPVILEIGFGMGETTAAMATAHPEWNLIGAEVYPAGVGALLAHIEKNDIRNIRIIEHDVVDVLAHMIPDGSLSAIHIYFPDPWPKKRHHKRRLIQPALVATLAHKLIAGGILHLATDWPDYAQHMLDVLSSEQNLENCAGSGFSPRPAWRPQTKFETRGLRLSNPIADLIFQKKTASE